MNPTDNNDEKDEVVFRKSNKNRLYSVVNIPMENMGNSDSEETQNNLEITVEDLRLSQLLYDNHKIVSRKSIRNDVESKCIETPIEPKELAVSDPEQVEKKKNANKNMIVKYIKNNVSTFVLTLIYIIAQIVLGIVQYEIYIDFNPAIKLARVCGILLNLNSSLVIMLVMRRMVTWLRNSFVGQLLPID